MSLRILIIFAVYSLIYCQGKKNIFLKILNILLNQAFLLINKYLVVKWDKRTFFPVFMSRTQRLCDFRFQCCVIVIVFEYIWCVYQDISARNKTCILVTYIPDRISQNLYICTATTFDNIHCKS